MTHNLDLIHKEMSKGNINIKAISLSNDMKDMLVLWRDGFITLNRMKENGDYENINVDISSVGIKL